MHLIFLLTYSPRFCLPPPESGQGFSIRPFTFALNAIEFQKSISTLLRKSFTIQFWIVKDFLKKIEMDFLKFNRL